jgi:hypothetical protein
MEGKKVLCVGGSFGIGKAFIAAGISAAQATESVTALGEIVRNLQSGLDLGWYQFSDIIGTSREKLPRKLKKRLYGTRAMRRNGYEN